MSNNQEDQDLDEILANAENEAMAQNTPGYISDVAFSSMQSVTKVSGVAKGDGLNKQNATPFSPGSEMAEKNNLHEAAKEGRVAIRPADVANELIHQLAHKFPAAVIVDKFSQLLDAKKCIPTQGGGIRVEPDSPVQLKAMELLLKYQLGLPVQRQEIIQKSYDSLDTLKEKLTKSPALRKAVGKIIDSNGAVDIEAEKDMNQARREIAKPKQKRDQADDETKHGTFF